MLHILSNRNCHARGLCVCSSETTKACRWPPKSTTPTNMMLLHKSTSCYRHAGNFQAHRKPSTTAGVRCLRYAYHDPVHETPHSFSLFLKKETRYSTTAWRSSVAQKPVVRSRHARRSDASPATSSRQRGCWRSECDRRRWCARLAHPRKPCVRVHHASIGICNSSMRIICCIGTGIASDGDSKDPSAAGSATGAYIVHVPKHVLRRLTLRRRILNGS